MRIKFQPRTKDRFIAEMDIHELALTINLFYFVKESTGLRDEEQDILDELESLRELVPGHSREPIHTEEEEGGAKV